MRRLWTIIGLAAALLPSGAVAAGNLPVHVGPYYSSNPLRVRAGEFSEGLESSKADVFEATIRKMTDAWPTLPVVPMYIAAIRLYDHGERDQAVYWFYAAQHRARLFREILDPEHVSRIGSPAFELSKAHDAFFELAGKWINGHAFCDRKAFEQTLGRVVSESKQVPRFATVYPDVEFIEASGWAARSAKVSAGLEDMIRKVDKDYDRIKAQRDASGATKRFCEAESQPRP